MIPMDVSIYPQEWLRHGSEYPDLYTVKLINHLRSYPVGLREETYTRIDALKLTPRLDWSINVDDSEEKITARGVLWELRQDLWTDFELHEIIQNHPDATPTRMMKNGLLTDAITRLRIFGIPLSRFIKKNERAIIQDTTTFLSTFEGQRHDNFLRAQQYMNNIHCNTTPITAAETLLGYPVSPIQCMTLTTPTMTRYWGYEQRLEKKWDNETVLQAWAFVLGADAIVDYYAAGKLTQATLVKKIT